jgi:decaprenylphospho-beta-D-ribofuranose 2-oxidase
VSSVPATLTQRTCCDGAERELSGWNRFPVVRSCVHRPEKVAALAAMVAAHGGRTMLARGAGRTYGDACCNPGGDTILTERLNRMLAFDEETGVLRCEAGVTIAEILDVFAPRGWFPPVTPGTKFVTVGGAVAFDVHGKNHHRDGSFGRFVRELTLLLACGDIVRCAPDERPELFQATIGGMGLTGVVLDLTLALQPLPSPFIAQATFKSRDLAETLALFDEHEPGSQYSVAWLDCLAGGRGLGRGVAMFGNHATAAEVRDARPPKRQRQLRVPFDVPRGLLNPLSMRTFNALYHARQAASRRALVGWGSFFYPLDFLRDWNRLYGRRGFVQYQCVFPTESTRLGVTQVLELCSARGRGSFLVVLKRFGEQQGWLSFPMAGCTLALDIPIRNGLWAFLDELDAVVLRHGGRVYLAKDARLEPASFRAMYPEWPRWAEVKEQVDPGWVFTSGLSQRLELRS